MLASTGKHASLQTQLTLAGSLSLSIQYWLVVYTMGSQAEIC